MSELWEELKKLSVPRKEPKEPKSNATRFLCEDKKAYSSKSRARSALRAVRAGFRAKIYKCEVCGEFHIANRDKATKALFKYKKVK